MNVGLFPGQGISPKLVLEALPRRDRSLGVASEVLGFDLRRQVETVARSSSTRFATHLAQPAIFVASLISCRRQIKEGGSFSYLVGHSLGEYAALVAAGAMSFVHGLKVVAARGDAMQRAANACPGGMVALLGLERDLVRDIAVTAGAAIANDNAPGQVVLAGSSKALTAVAALAQPRGGRTVRLPVEAAFHTESMRPAADAVREALFAAEVRNPVVPVISNVTARPYRAPGEIRRLLVEQLTSPVRFREAVEWIWSKGGRNYLDLGPGSVVGPLAARTMRAAREKVRAAHA